MSKNNSERLLTPTFDKKGNPEWKSTLSSPDDSCAVCHMIPDRVIPVIFVPGVMGSNLKGTGNAGDISWRLDSVRSMSPWLSRGAALRKKYLAPQKMVVDDDGARPDGTAQHDEELKRRGWGEVGAMSYGDFLVWLENALNDFVNTKGGPRDLLINKALGSMKSDDALLKEQVALSYRYRFPVHACGYNWLDGNDASAEQLKQRINAVITRYKQEKKRCEKVILVTHSMGGLVARYCSEVLGMSDKILGIVHGVMPAIGAAAVYRRFKAGTEGAWLAAKVLGEDAAEMTAVLSSAPGPLQLLPTPEYGNGWLKIDDGSTVVSLPRNNDPYNEIYTVRGRWWSMCEDYLINPRPSKSPPREQREIDADWAGFSALIHGKIKDFHHAIKEKYHHNTYAFFGSDREFKAYGTVCWRTTFQSIRRPPLPRPEKDVFNAKPHFYGELGETRTALYPGMSAGQTVPNEVFRISEPDEEGDGTVPHRSGIAPKEHTGIKSMLRVSVGHEPAYKDSAMAREFTLRSIVQIAQAIKGTSLDYE
ncbi:hypothetical protein [Herbaspirillum sp. C9C3]|uniref:esterase/lipase family protein n=1 Tax=Herbaspirillum sp. C9C3 TaxID=2735271 RepID=UPI001584969F|nr:hypothetical protein [Herbaspirillum sp. C9C3]NUT63758.1 hypothetical protein [Herbaspirillum sp. C9C3]